MIDDDEDYPPEGGCLGIGATHAVSERTIRKVNKNPIGFVHFPEKAEKKPPAKPAKRPAKRRKR